MKLFLPQYNINAELPDGMPEADVQAALTQLRVQAEGVGSQEGEGEAESTEQPELPSAPWYSPIGIWEGLKRGAINAAADVSSAAVVGAAGIAQGGLRGAGAMPIRTKEDMQARLDMLEKPLTDVGRWRQEQAQAATTVEPTFLGEVAQQVPQLAQFAALGPGALATTGIGDYSSGLAAGDPQALENAIARTAIATAAYPIYPYAGRAASTLLGGDIASGAAKFLAGRLASGGGLGSMGAVQQAGEYLAGLAPAPTARDVAAGFLGGMLVPGRPETFEQARVHSAMAKRAENLNVELGAEPTVILEGKPRIPEPPKPTIVEAARQRLVAVDIELEAMSAQVAKEGLPVEELKASLTRVGDLQKQKATYEALIEGSAPTPEGTGSTEAQQRIQELTDQALSPATAQLVTEIKATSHEDFQQQLASNMNPELAAVTRVLSEAGYEYYKTSHPEVTQEDWYQGPGLGEVRGAPLFARFVLGGEPSIAERMASGAGVTLQAGHLIRAFSSTGIEEFFTGISRAFKDILVPEDKAIVDTFVGAKPEEPWTSAQDEKWSSSFNTYIMKGKAPNKPLTGLFERAGQWLTKIYTGLRKSEVDIKLTPSLVKVFDKLTGGQASIEHILASAEGILGHPITKAPRARADSVKALHKALRFYTHSTTPERTLERGAWLTSKAASIEAKDPLTAHALRKVANDTYTALEGRGLGLLGDLGITVPRLADGTIDFTDARATLHAARIEAQVTGDAAILAEVEARVRHVGNEQYVALEPEFLATVQAKMLGAGPAALQDPEGIKNFAAAAQHILTMVAGVRNETNRARRLELEDTSSLAALTAAQQAKSKAQKLANKLAAQPGGRAKPEWMEATNEVKQQGLIIKNIQGRRKGLERALSFAPVPGEQTTALDLLKLMDIQHRPVEEMAKMYAEVYGQKDVEVTGLTRPEFEQATGRLMNVFIGISTMKEGEITAGWATMMEELGHGAMAIMRGTPIYGYAQKAIDEMAGNGKLPAKYKSGAKKGSFTAEQEELVSASILAYLATGEVPPSHPELQPVFDWVRHVIEQEWQTSKSLAVVAHGKKVLAIPRANPAMTELAAKLLGFDPFKTDYMDQPRSAPLLLPSKIFKDVSGEEDFVLGKDLEGPPTLAITKHADLNKYADSIPKEKLQEIKATLEENGLTLANLYAVMRDEMNAADDAIVKLTALSALPDVEEAQARVTDYIREARKKSDDVNRLMGSPTSIARLSGSLLNATKSAYKYRFYKALDELSSTLTRVRFVGGERKPTKDQFQAIQDALAAMGQGDEKLLASAIVRMNRPGIANRIWDTINGTIHTMAYSGMLSGLVLNQVNFVTSFAWRGLQIPAMYADAVITGMFANVHKVLEYEGIKRVPIIGEKLFSPPYAGRRVYREEADALAGSYLRSLGGFRSDIWREVWAIMKTGHDPAAKDKFDKESAWAFDLADERLGEGATNIATKTVATILNAGPRFMLAMDLLNGGSAFSDRLVSLAARHAAAQGLRGDNFKTARDAWLEECMKLEGTRSAEAEADVEIARKFAAYCTFRDTLDRGARWIAKGRNIASNLPVLNLAVLAYMPFMVTTYNIAKRGAELNPIGAVVSSFFEKTPDGKFMGSRMFTDPIAIRKLAVSVILTAAITALYNNGMITGSPSDDPDEQARDEEFKRKPFSILMAGHWVRYKNIATPFDIPIAVWVDTLHAFEKARRSKIRQAAVAAKANPALGPVDIDSIDDMEGYTTYAKALQECMVALKDAMVDSTFFGRFRDLMDARPGEKLPFEKATADLAANMIPASSFTKEVNDMIEAGRTGQVLKKIPLTLPEKLAQRIPGAIGMVPAPLTAKTALGHEIVSGEGGPLRQFFALKWSDAELNDPVLVELNRLQDVTLMPRFPNRPAHIMDGIELTSAQYDKLITMTGNAMQKRLAAAIASPGYQAIVDDNRKMDYLARAWGLARAAAVAKFRREELW